MSHIIRNLYVALALLFSPLIGNRARKYQRDTKETRNWKQEKKGTERAKIETET